MFRGGNFSSALVEKTTSTIKLPNKPNKSIKALDIKFIFIVSIRNRNRKNFIFFIYSVGKFFY